MDFIISLGYRIKSKTATQFRIWATKTLKDHLIQGYTINKKQIGENYQNFMQAVADVKELLLPGNILDFLHNRAATNIFDLFPFYFVKSFQHS